MIYEVVIGHVENVVSHITRIRMATINKTGNLLVRMQRNWNTCAELMAIAMENMVVPQKIKPRIAIYAAIPLMGTYPKK